MKNTREYSRTKMLEEMGNIPLELIKDKEYAQYQQIYESFTFFVDATKCKELNKIFLNNYKRNRELYRIGQYQELLVISGIIYLEYNSYGI